MVFFRKIWVAIALSMTVLTVAAEELDFSGGFSGLTAEAAEERFNNISTDLGNFISFRDGQAAGTPWFRFGINTAFASLQSSEDFESVDVNTEALALPQFYAGFGFRSFDVSLTYINASLIDAQVVGGSLKYAIVDHIALPSVSARVGYSQLNGIDALRLSTVNIDLTVSKNFLFVEPYAQLGLVQTAATLDEDKIDGFDENVAAYEQSDVRWTIGLNFTVAVVLDIGVSYGQIGSNPGVTTVNFGLGL